MPFMKDIRNGAVLFGIDISKVDWDMVSAIGTCAGALFTFLAIVFALNESLRNSTPKVHAEAILHVKIYDMSLYAKDKTGAIYSMILTVSNVGYCRICIKKFIVDRPGYKAIEIPVDAGLDSSGSGLGKKPYRALEPGDEISRNYLVAQIAAGIPGRKRWLAKFFRAFSGRPYRMFVVDTAGNKHRIKVEPELQDAIAKYQSDFEGLLSRQADAEGHAQSIDT